MAFELSTFTNPYLVKDLQEICAICIETVEPNKSHSFECELDSSIPSIKLLDVIESVSKFKSSESVVRSLLICTTCLSRAENAYKFQKMCNKAQCYLEDYIKQQEVKSTNINVKQEAEDSDSIVGDNFDKLNNDEEQGQVIEEVMLKNENNTSENDGIDSYTNNNPLENNINGNINEKYKHNLDTDKNELVDEQYAIEHNVEDCKDESDKGDTDIDNNDSVNVIRNDGKEKKTGRKVFTEEERKRRKKEYYNRRVACQVCNKGIQLGHMHSHMRVHTGEKPHSCDFCDKVFATKWSLLLHLRVHTKEKPFKCTYCDKSFPYQKSLVLHTHSHENRRDYMCKFCGKTFITVGALKGHESTHGEERPYACEFCDKTFKVRGSLRIHSSVHTKEKPHVCEHCGKGFSQKCGLGLHLKTHTGEKPHKCELCGRGFIQAQKLRMHLQTHAKKAAEGKQMKSYRVLTYATAYTPNVHEDAA